MSDAGIQLAYDALGRLVLTLPSGEQHAGVVPVRCFPFTAPRERISFLDESGRELFRLPSLDDLADAARTVLERDLAKREFFPTIEKVHSITLGADPTLWHVMTDRGEVRFALPSEDSIRRLSPHGALIADSHGVRYRILDLRRLDASSRKLLGRYL